MLDTRASAHAVCDQAELLSWMADLFQMEAQRKLQRHGGARNLGGHGRQRISPLQRRQRLVIEQLRSGTLLDRHGNDPAVSPDGYIDKHKALLPSCSRQCRIALVGFEVSGQTVPVSRKITRGWLLRLRHGLGCGRAGGSRWALGDVRRGGAARGRDRPRPNRRWVLDGRMRYWRGQRGWRGLWRWRLFRHRHLGLRGRWRRRGLWLR